jgi:ABC-type ATPase involved in cell division
VEAKFFLVNFCGFNVPRRNLNYLHGKSKAGKTTGFNVPRRNLNQEENFEIHFIVLICQGGI